MRERPILMTPENAQKCHDGTKTQTRRLNGLEEVNSGLWDYPQMTKPGVFTFLDTTQANPYNNALDVKCPYGVVGDRLWVRENGWERPARTPKMLRDGADTWERFYFDALMDSGEAEELKGYGFKHRPSIHMPRWACRTVLEMTEVRVERLQGISEEDAQAEGAAFACAQCGNDLDTQHGSEVHAACDDLDCEQASHREGFRRLWISINGKGSWELNPWVWVIAFRKVGACGR